MTAIPDADESLPQNGRAANALRHGLTAKKVLPLDLTASVAELRGKLVAELAPQTTLARILVEEMSRHAAAMRHAEVYEAAVLRSAYQQAESLSSLLEGSSDPDERVAAMMTSLSIERTTRYRRHHERAFYASLTHLANQSHGPLLEIAGFAGEEACCKWLWDWQREQPWQCPRCGDHRRNWLQARWRWECVCRHQYSIRHGTVYAASRVALEKWFSAVIAIVVEPGISNSSLAGRIGLARRATVSSISARVRLALDSDRSTSALAGVNEYAMGCLRQAAKPSGPVQNKSRPQNSAPSPFKAPIPHEIRPTMRETG